jgi:hypothetical protein
MDVKPPVSGSAGLFFRGKKERAGLLMEAGSFRQMKKYLIKFIGTFFLVLAAGMTAIDRADAQGFVPVSTNNVGNGPVSIAAADVSGDGRPDLIVADFSDGALTVLINSGSGSFVTASSPGVGNGPISIATADVNGDGKPDLICANSTDGTLMILTNNGIGGFVLAATRSVGGPGYAPQAVIAADINGNGIPALISPDENVNELTITTNQGGNYIIAATPFTGSQPIAVTAADVNGDGKIDLICANYTGDSGNGTLTVLTNGGGGKFVTSSSPVVGTGPISVAAADVNGDGKMDLICANYGSGTLTVLTNNGSGKFVLSSSPVVGTGPISVTAADVNGDGKMDLVCANFGGNTLTVLTNNGTGRFVTAATLHVGNAPVSVAVSDVNGDGRPDLICANRSDNTLTVLTNSFQFTPPSLNIAPAGNQVVVFYPPSGSHFMLQTTTNLALGPWVTASNGMLVTAFAFTNTPPAAFFRLH